MNIIIKTSLLFMKFIYFIIKIFTKQKNRIVLISRQSNKVTIDYKYLINEIHNMNDSIDIIILCKKIDKGLYNKILYIFHMFKQMYYISTSKIVILDSFCIVVSNCKHKNNTKIIQIWHALGALKEFGYSSLGKDDGRSLREAKLFNMHKNYDYILTSSEYSMKYFMQAFNVKKQQMRIMSLPRVDYLKSINEKQLIIKEFTNKYNISMKKKIILYCPTYRKNLNVDLNIIKKSINYSKYNLIIKLHDSKGFIYTDRNSKIVEDIYSGMELLHIADYIITDYSAIVYECAIVNKPIYFYTPDLDKYINSRGFYLEYKKDMPGYISNNINIILKKIENNEFNYKKLERFKNKYITNLDNCTNKLAVFINNLLK